MTQEAGRAAGRDRPSRPAPRIEEEADHAEVLGAIGLILPGLLRIRPGLTPLAAAGLVTIMIGAAVVTLAIGGGASALIPLVLGLLAAFVAYGRQRLAPVSQRESFRAPALQAAR